MSLRNQRPGTAPSLHFPGCGALTGCRRGVAPPPPIRDGLCCYWRTMFERRDIRPAVQATPYLEARFPAQGGRAHPVLKAIGHSGASAN